MKNYFLIPVSAPLPVRTVNNPPALDFQIQQNKKIPTFEMLESMLIYSTSNFFSRTK